MDTRGVGSKGRGHNTNTDHGEQVSRGPATATRGFSYNHMNGFYWGHQYYENRRSSRGRVREREREEKY